jgi:ribulose-5-phosphate 4-epimerase/fuculose-1-phosphate aldolase
MAVAALKKQPQMSDAEWEARCQLAALYHVCDHLGWTDTINTHMSMRVPDEPNAMLINRHGEMFDEMTASSLLKMDFDGNVVGEPGKFNRAGFIIHSGVYKARPDANVVMHTHTRAGAGVSLIPNGIRPISQDALHVYDDLAYHEYGVPASAEECEELGRTCAHGSCVVLYNHGLLTLGETVQGTFQKTWMLERACELEVIARQMGVEPKPISNYVISKAAERMKSIRNTSDYGRLEWEGMVRTVDKKGFDYRQ